ncbi:hypothetical protein FRC03_009736 [Tulasnella sp. 419]|nr:hypothetical protein FRC03_009736 [Tulasnella sp. 419]
MASRLPSSRTAAPNKNTIRVIDGPSARIICVADIRGQISHLNTLALEHNAQVIIHTGDFGFYENASLSRMNDRALKHLVTYSPLITSEERDRLLNKDNSVTKLRDEILQHQSPVLSEFPLLLSGKLKLSVPVYTVWGACEDVFVLERFRLGEYDIPNLHVIDEATSRLLDIGGVKIRLLGLGGALVPHKLFDNGEGQATIAGGQGTMWITALQIGELVDTAQRVFDTSETRLFVSHVSPGREGLIAQLALVLKADLTISGGLHFRYASSYNDFSVHGDMEGYRSKLMSGKELFGRIWDNVRTQVESAIDEDQRVLLEKAVLVTERIPPNNSAVVNEEQAWKNCWNWNLCDAAYGHLILEFSEGRVSAEMKSQGFNYAYRRAQSTSPAQGSNIATLEGGVAAIPSSPHSLKPSASVDSAQPAIGPASPRKVTNEPAMAVVDKLVEDHINKGAEVQHSTADATTGVDSAAQSSIANISSPTNETTSLALTPASANPVASPKDKSGNDSDVGIDRSSGRRTPNTAGRRPRNPWTLFVSKLPVPSTEHDLREFFGVAKDGITVVKLPVNHATRTQRSIAFVEFKDEPSMRAGLASHAEKIKDNIVRVSIAENREDPAVASDGGDAVNNGQGRGRGSFRSKGPRGNGLFANALGQMQGTLGRGSVPPRKLSNGDHQLAQLETSAG